MSQKTTMIIAVAVVAIVAVAAVAIVLTKDKGSDDETYYYYLYFADGNDKNGWYSADADNASDGFTNAMEDADLSWEKSSWGYIASIDGNAGYNSWGWSISAYTYSHTDSTAADASSGVKLNGWTSFAGYDSDEHDGFKLWQSNCNIWFLTPYTDGVTPDPSTVSTWKNSGPFEEDIADDSKQDYSFYLYFGADNAKNGWYTASASNASDAFTDAMEDADLAWTKSSWGYIASIDGNAGYNSYGWSLMTYAYSATDSTAADASSGTYLNGWKSFAGYDSDEHDGFKLWQSNCNIWFLTPYTDGVTPDPSTVSSWKASGPFAE